MVAATLIATIAVVGLAYTFSTGRGFVNRFEVARAALAAAQGRLAVLGAARDTSAALTPGILHTAPFTVDGRVYGVERWAITWRDVPADGAGGADPDTFDMRLATVEVVFAQAGATDSVRLSRLLTAF